VVDAPLLRRALWPALAVLAVGVLLALALHGERPGAGLEKFEASGLMVHIDPASISEIEINAGARRWRFAREGRGWRVVEAALTPPADLAARIEGGLKLLHNAAPERILSGDELSAQASFGLEPPVLSVVATGAARFAIAFGASNPLGLARYSRVEGRADVALVPGYVAEAWEGAVGLR
jgi:hypothetical protein